jgi:hypothetical protein
LISVSLTITTSASAANVLQATNQLAANKKKRATQNGSREPLDGDSYTEIKDSSHSFGMTSFFI